jgi:hypothetical protein
MPLCSRPVTRCSPRTRTATPTAAWSRGDARRRPEPSCASPGQLTERFWLGRARSRKCPCVLMSRPQRRSSVFSPTRSPLAPSGTPVSTGAGDACASSGHQSSRSSCHPCPADQGATPWSKDRQHVSHGSGKRLMRSPEEDSAVVRFTLLSRRTPCLHSCPQWTMSG